MSSTRNFPRSLFEREETFESQEDADVLYKLATVVRNSDADNTVPSACSTNVIGATDDAADVVEPLYKLATSVSDGEWEEEEKVPTGVDLDAEEPLYKLAHPLIAAESSFNGFNAEVDGRDAGSFPPSICSSHSSSSSRDSSPRQIATRSQTVGIQTRHKQLKRDIHTPSLGSFGGKSPSVGPAPSKRTKRPIVHTQQQQPQRKKRKISESNSSTSTSPRDSKKDDDVDANNVKKDNKTTSNKREWEAWCPADKDAFFEGKYILLQLLSLQIKSSHLKMYCS